MKLSLQQIMETMIPLSASEHAPLPICVLGAAHDGVRPCQVQNSTVIKFLVNERPYHLPACMTGATSSLKIMKKLLNNHKLLFS